MNLSSKTNSVKLLLNTEKGTDKRCFFSNKVNSTSMYIFHGFYVYNNVTYFLMLTFKRSPNNNFSVLKIRGAGLPGPSPGSASANSLSIALKITCDDGT